MPDSLRDQLLDVLTRYREFDPDYYVDALLPLIQAHVEAECVRRAAEARADGAGDALKLLEAGLHLAMYGEHAPGGNETWGAHWHDVELFLRGSIVGRCLARGSEDSSR